MCVNGDISPNFKFYRYNQCAAGDGIDFFGTESLRMLLERNMWKLLLTVIKLSLVADLVANMTVSVADLRERLTAMSAARRFRSKMSADVVKSFANLAELAPTYGASNDQIPAHRLYVDSGRLKDVVQHAAMLSSVISFEHCDLLTLFVLRHRHWARLRIGRLR